MNNPPNDWPSLEARGFHFYRGGEKWLVKGVTYGPFRPDDNGDPYPAIPQMKADFDRMKEAGINTLRLYTPAPDVLAALAQERGLYLLIDIPWPRHLEVYGKPDLEKQCFQMVEDGIRTAMFWPNVLGVIIGNEIPADLARWVTTRRVEDFLRRLYYHAKAIHPNRLVGFANFPSTEFLQLPFFDFLGFNVYLEDYHDLQRYLYRLRHLYPEIPLLLSETGMDSGHNGEEEQARVLEFSLKAAFQAGLSGTVIFSWTDEWHTGGYDIEDWCFGLVDHERRPKAALASVHAVYENAPQCAPLSPTPRVSVVVATYNGAATLRDCLRSLEKLNYPDYEIIVIDDGSTDETPVILGEIPSLRVFRQENKGLSAARNQGISLATGEIVAFTDSDCIVDPDWLYFLVWTMVSHRCAGVGGPNLTPWEKEPLHRTVAYAPGHATHVLLDTLEAEHVPGCNMAFWRSDLFSAGCFDTTYKKAGDDVDIIWRLQDQGKRVLFAPAAFVWHHRRSTIGAYLKQQKGYGEAEALLLRKHPHRFNDRGQSLWRGVIYAGQELLPLFRTHDIHFGVFGSAGFQCLYERRGSFPSFFLTSIEWWLICVLLMASGLFSTAALLAGVTGAVVSILTSGWKAGRKFRNAKELSSRFFPIVWLLWILQPIVRGWKRYIGLFTEHSQVKIFRQSLSGESKVRSQPIRMTAVREYWSEKGLDRLTVIRLLSEAMTRRGWLHSPNSGWEPWDFTVVLSQWFRSRVTSVEENHGEGKRLARLRLSLAPTSLFTIFAVVGLAISLLISFQDTLLARLMLLVLLVVAWRMFSTGIKTQALIAGFFERILCDIGYITIENKAKPLRDVAPPSTDTQTTT
jgi:glycosyltransferase involved in cell wall biosynthesis